MSIKFRSAQLGDIPAIAGLLATLFSIEKDFTPDTARQITGLKLMLQREDILLWVAEETLEGESQLVGFCSVQTLISTAEGGVVALIEDVVVPDEFRGAGIGRQLLEGAEAWARRRGCTRLQLLADEGNLQAQGFYAQIGWQQTHMRNWRKLLSKQD